MFFRHWLFDFGHHSEENLDRPPSNFDIGGIPRGAWSSGIFACHENIIPSCVMSFFCPCIMWGQVVIRSQIPLLIAVKNSIQTFRSHSGYSFFVNSFLLSFALFIIFLIAGIFVHTSSARSLLFALCAVVFLFLFFVLGHVRTAFKMKYSIPSVLPRGSEFWDCLLDAFLSTLCMPCAIAQMARHVFQYRRWNPPIGLYFKDPYALPPLEVVNERPAIADEAGILWTEDVPHPNAHRHRGADDRPTTNQSLDSPLVYVAPAYPVEENETVYQADGTVAHRYS